MNEFKPIPASISHKELHSLLINAYKESTFDIHSSAQDIDSQEEFKNLTASWLEGTKNLINFLKKNQESLTDGKPSNSVMALGAMEVHINMAVNAFNAFKSKGY